MEEIKRKLVESGVIGRVVDDFNPLIELTVLYGEKRISIGDEVTPVEVQRGPTSIEHHSYAVEICEPFRKGELVSLVMTDPDAPGGEYLHWLITYFIVTDDQELSWKELVPYEPPRPGAHKIVLTLFKVENHIDFICPWPVFSPNSREEFRTIAFAYSNDFGPPLGASFFNIKNENEENQKSKEQSKEHIESTSKQPEVRKSTKKRKKFKKLASLY